MIPGTLNTMLLSVWRQNIPIDYIARYEARDVSGATLVDKTGNHDGSVAGAQLIAGNLLRFDGVDDYTSMSALLTTMKTKSSGTVAIHFRAPPGGRAYFALGDSASSAFVQYSVSETDIVFAFNLNTGVPLGVNNFTVARTAALIVPNQYHKVIFVSDSTDGCKLYFDGVEQIPNANQGTPNGKWWPDNPTNNSRLMSLDYGFTDLFYKGDMVSLTIYDYPMDAPGIAQLSSERNPTVTLGTMFGDSITVGVGASTYANSWAGKTLDAFGFYNYAVSGSQAADQSAVIQSSATAAGEQYTLMVGTNDHRTYRTDGAKQAAFKAFFRQCLAWLLLPVRTTARSVGVTTTGVWSNTAVNTIGKNTSTLGAKASATFNGTGVIVGIIIQDSTSAQSTVTVKVDGSSVGTFSCYAAMTTVNGLAYAPAALYFGGFSSGAHTIEMENTVTGKLFYLDYIAETNQSPYDVVVSNIIEMSSAAYTTYSTSQANVITFNGIISDVISEFAAEGITVPLVDNYSTIVPATHLDDGVHPNDTGHALIHTNMVAAF